MEINIELIQGAQTGAETPDKLRDMYPKVNQNFAVVKQEVERQAARVDNLTENSGSSNLEIVDARIGKDGTVYSSLKQRLDASTGGGEPSIIDDGADKTGAVSSYAALVTAINRTTTDTIRITKGVYLVGTNLTIPAGKTLHFQSGARLKIASGITLTVNGGIVAGSQDWIFDCSLSNSLVNGDPQIDGVFPTWFGAKGDGLTDDLNAFNAAMNLCGYAYPLYIPLGNFRVTDTIINKARGIVGVSGDDSRLTFDAPLTSGNDKKPCLRIGTEAYNNTEFVDFSVWGVTPYRTNNLATYINPTLFAQRKYEMFAPGLVGIETVDGAKPVFTRIITGDLKIGLLSNSGAGHNSFYDCSFNGLIGWYVYRNSGDYFLQGGGFNGAFAGIMCGIAEWVGHYGGIELTVKRVHTGFSPYGVYQVIDASNYDSLPVVQGISGDIQTMRFEMIGEAAISLLPKSISNFRMDGFGLSWSMAGSSEDYTLPTAILAAGLRQQYAVSLGKIYNCSFGTLTGVAAKSGATSSISGAWIEYLDGECDLTGLGDDIRIGTKNPRIKLITTTVDGLELILNAKASNPISAGQMLANPEDPTMWDIYNAASITAVDIPDYYGSIAEMVLGDGVKKAIKITPNSGTNAAVTLWVYDAPHEDVQPRTLNLEYFIYCPAARVMRSRISMNGAGQYMYDTTHSIPANKWTRIRCLDEYPRVSGVNNVEFLDLHPTQPTYLVGVMLSQDTTRSYSPFNHAFTYRELETGAGVVVPDTTNGKKYILRTTNGVVTATEWSPYEE